jgi:hypothetical protein
MRIFEFIGSVCFAITFSVGAYTILKWSFKGIGKGWLELQRRN